MDRKEIRLALPSKGRLSDDSLSLLARAGMEVYKPNPRQFQAVIPSLPEVTVLFQRAGDIAVSVHDGTVDFGITGWDVVSEKGGTNGEILPLYKALGFGSCSLNVIVPDDWVSVRTMSDLSEFQGQLGRPLRVATKFPNCTAKFFQNKGLGEVQLITAEGTLEIAPTIGYTDLIVDLVSTGTTIRDNHLRLVEDGLILESQACLVANRLALNTNPQALAIAKKLIEFIVAHLRAENNVAVFANIRGKSAQGIADRMLPKPIIGGLQGPTISPLMARDGGDWYAVNIIVRKDRLADAIEELRSIGGSGVVVLPVMYIFEEEPEAYIQMLEVLKDDPKLKGVEIEP
jgi:ATP phosphoribosyltransferase